MTQDPKGRTEKQPLDRKLHIFLSPANLQTWLKIELESSQQNVADDNSLLA